jgi:hypothetical protein
MQPPSPTLPGSQKFSRRRGRIGRSLPRCHLWPRWRAGEGATIIGLLLALCTPALAHPPQRGAPPDLVRLQGYRGAAPAGIETRKVAVNVHGREQPFFAIDLRRFSLVDPGATDAPDLQKAFFLQGGPETLSRFAKARPDQRITILAQWHPGRRDLFVLALDLCPEQ